MIDFDVNGGFTIEGALALRKWKAKRADASVPPFPIIDPSLIMPKESPTKMHIKVWQRSDKSFEVTVWHDEVLIETRAVSRINFDRGDTLTMSFDVVPSLLEPKETK